MPGRRISSAARPERSGSAASLARATALERDALTAPFTLLAQAVAGLEQARGEALADLHGRGAGTAEAVPAQAEPV